MKKGVFFAILVLAPALTGCNYFSDAKGGPVAADTPESLAEAMTGRFASAPDDKGSRVEDFRVPVHNMGPGEWIYFQRNQGPETRTERRAYRQRVLQLVSAPGGGVSQITWSLKAPELFASAPRHPGVLKALDKKALKLTMEAGCEQRWLYDAGEGEGGMWRGRVDPVECTIYSQRRQKRIGIGSETRLSANSLREAERGFDLDGTQLWGTPPGAFTEMKRTE
ncbi:MAG: chromophore lyase CpcT/CpeT [Pseudomonadota bacterium]